jgi:hypothetical protein
MTLLQTHQESIDDLVKRRQEVATAIHSLWTDGGSDVAGLAGPLFDGRLDALGRFAMLVDFHEEAPEMMEIPKIPYRDATTMPYETFRQDFMLPNVPVMIRGLTNTWGARKWLRKDGNESVPDMGCLCELFGPEVVPIHTQSTAGFTVSRPTTCDMTVEEYAGWWELHNLDPQDDLLYLKDWKFAATLPDVDAYEWPIFFQDDWLNEAMGNAYKFMYLGPAGTSTRLHADVLRSFSWSTNVCGRKRWYLIPPEYTYLLMDCFGRNLAPDLHADLVHGLDSLYPGLKYARDHAFEVMQEAGETIFVPSTWFHSVENLAPTLSINHNWLNGANVSFSWKKLRAELETLNNHREGKQEDGKSNENDTSQVGDDLVLLWLVLSKKARGILGHVGLPTEADRFDLEAILPILEEIQRFVDEGQDEGLTERCDCDVHELIIAVKESLNAV